jgi:hypothetical protein
MTKRFVQPDGEMFAVYLGPVGSGKSLVTSEDVILPALMSGVEVMSSCWFNWDGPNFHYFDDIEQVTSFQNGLLYLDDISIILDPRDHEKESRAVRAFASLHRHQFVDIIINTQSYDLIAKTFRQQAVTFYYCDQIYKDSLLSRAYELLFRRPWSRVVIQVTPMTLKEIKMLDMPDFSNFEDEPSLFEVFSVDRTWYDIKKLLHLELDGYKQEYIHFYCDKCRHRQGDQIRKEDTEKYAVRDEKDGLWYPKPKIDFGFCPKHPDNPLTIKNSSMYDSYYIPEIKPVDIIWKPFVKGDPNRLVPFRGALSQGQQEAKKLLDSAAR